MLMQSSGWPGSGQWQCAVGLGRVGDDGDTVFWDGTVLLYNFNSTVNTVQGTASASCYPARTGPGCGGNGV